MVWMKVVGLAICLTQVLIHNLAAKLRHRLDQLPAARHQEILADIWLAAALILGVLN